MSKNVLILSTSPRKNGNSDRLAQMFLEGAREAGNQAELIRLADCRLEFCRGCLACQKTGRCVIRDDAREIVEKMAKADVLVFATPVYYYEMSGQLKTMLDRSNPLFASEYTFREVYLLTAAAEDTPEVPSRVEQGVEGWISCFDRCQLAGSVFAGGVTAVGDIDGHPSLEKARDLGRSIR